MFFNGSQKRSSAIEFMKNTQISFEKSKKKKIPFW